MKNKLLTFIGVIFVVILVIVSVLFFRNSSGNTDRTGKQKEEEFEKSLIVTAQSGEPDDESKKLASKLGVDAKNVVSTGKQIASTKYSFTVLSWTRGKEYPGYVLPKGKDLSNYPGAELDEQ